MTEKKFRLGTTALHAGQVPDPTTGWRTVPIYQTSSYVFRNTEHAANLFGLRELGNIYTRLMNPTTDVFEKRIAAIEGGTGAIATASGAAAITYAVLNITRPGDEIVSADNLYGGTYEFFHYTLPKFGRHVVFVDSSKPEEFRKAITGRQRRSMPRPSATRNWMSRISRRLRRLPMKPVSLSSLTTRPESALSARSIMARISSSFRRPSISAGTGTRSVASSSTPVSSRGTMASSPSSPSRTRVITA